MALGPQFGSCGEYFVEGLPCDDSLGKPSMLRAPDAAKDVKPRVDVSESRSALLGVAQIARNPEENHGFASCGEY